MRFLVITALCLAACAPAGGEAPDIRAGDAWARATGPGGKASAAYLVIANSGGGDDALVAIESSQGAATLHSTSMDGGIMRMRMLDRLAIPAGSHVELKPGATHLMLTGLDRPLTQGEEIELRLRFEKSGVKRVVAKVRPQSGEAH